MKNAIKFIFVNGKKFKLIIFLLFFTISLFIYMFLSQIDVVSPGRGLITGENDKVIIKSPNSGFIDSFNLHEGEKINKGTVLFSYTNLDYTYKGMVLQDLISFNEEKISLLRKDSELLNGLLTSPSSIDSLGVSDGSLSYLSFREENEYLNSEENNLLAKELLVKQEIELRQKQINFLQRKGNLLKNGGASEIDILTNAAEIERQKTELVNVKINMLSLRNDFDSAKSKFKIKLRDQIYNISEKLADLQKSNIENIGELKLTNGKVSTNSVTSPFSGEVLKIESNLKKGSFIEQYQPVVTLKQDNTGRIINARFDTKYRPYLYEGATVKIAVDSTAFKRNFTGKILKISADSFLDDSYSNSQSRYYNVTIGTIDGKGLVDIPEGVEVNVFAISKKVSIFEYVTATLKSNMFFNVW